MKVLLDTNILIPAEPMLRSGLHPNTKQVVALLRALNTSGHDVFRHPASSIDFARDGNVERRRSMSVLVQKYAELPNPPGIPSDLRGLIGESIPGSPDEVDDLLLAAVHSGSVHLLISEDQRLHRKAEIAQLADRVRRLDSALLLFGALKAGDLPPPPAVHHLLCNRLNMSDPIWTSFRQDYPGFDDWFSAQCLQPPRDCWIIPDARGTYLAVCIVKPETDSAHRLVLKICSFKVAPLAVGRGISELLLRAVLDHAFNKDYDRLYVEVLPVHRDLIAFLSRFGFRDLGGRKPIGGDLILEKDLAGSPEQYASLSPLEFNILYGPQRIKIPSAAVFIVPIRPEYHALLFPDLELQGSLLAGSHAFGNAIRKAYLCQSPTRELPPGSILLFYRSGGPKRVDCVGVVERTLRSDEPDRVLGFVWPRTVYSEEQVTRMCKDGVVLAIQFRYSRSLRPPLTLSQFRKAGALKGPPQSITQITSGITTWLQGALEKLP